MTIRCNLCGRALTKVSAREVARRHGASWTLAYGPKCAAELGLPTIPKRREPATRSAKVVVDERQLELELA